MPPQSIPLCTVGSQELAVLSNALIDKLNKHEVAKYACDLTKAYQQLYSTLFNKENGIIVRLESQLAVSTNVNNYLLKRPTEVEKASNDNAQYARKETIELQGFNPNIADDEVEDKVLHINSIRSENEPIYTSNDIQACHKLKNKKNVICKFVSRKRMRNVIINRKKLKDKNMKGQGVTGKLFTGESMAPTFKSLDWKCRQLKKAKMIQACWFYNGKYTAQLNNNVKKKIFHIVDLTNYLSTTVEEIDKVCQEWKDKVEG